MKTQLALISSLLLLQSSFLTTAQTNDFIESSYASEFIAPKIVSGELTITPYLKTSTNRVSTVLVGSGILKLGSSCIQIEGNYEDDYSVDKAETSPTTCPYEITSGVFERIDDTHRTCYKIASESSTVIIGNKGTSKQTRFYEKDVSCPQEKT